MAERSAVVSRLAARDASWSCIEALRPSGHSPTEIGAITSRSSSLTSSLAPTCSSTATFCEPHSGASPNSALKATLRPATCRRKATLPHGARRKTPQVHRFAPSPEDGFSCTLRWSWRSRRPAAAKTGLAASQRPSCSRHGRSTSAVQSMSRAKLACAMDRPSRHSSLSRCNSSLAVPREELRLPLSRSSASFTKPSTRSLSCPSSCPKPSAAWLCTSSTRPDKASRASRKTSPWRCSSPATAACASPKRASQTFASLCKAASNCSRAPVASARPASTCTCVLPTDSARRCLSAASSCISAVSSALRPSTRPARASSCSFPSERSCSKRFRKPASSSRNALASEPMAAESSAEMACDDCRAASCAAFASSSRTRRIHLASSHSWPTVVRRGSTSTLTVSVTWLLTPPLTCMIFCATPKSSLEMAAWISLCTCSWRWSKSCCKRSWQFNT
mmetsp:Transcript_137349/g.293482  ORF Transcript_137349/g.293482 Transcript_137349/m.293482 type:complete len:449 (-) Transcript_137349:266-1612(-)